LLRMRHCQEPRARKRPARMTTHLLARGPINAGAGTHLRLLHANNVRASHMTPIGEMRDDRAPVEGDPGAWGSGISATWRLAGPVGSGEVSVGVRERPLHAPFGLSCSACIAWVWTRVAVRLLSASRCPSRLRDVWQRSELR